MTPNRIPSAVQDSVVVIPAYEPTPSLAPLTAALAASGYSVLVVDDGSGEGYETLWQEIHRHAVILHHLENQGKGAALKTAFHYIENFLPAAGCIITMDADGQHLPQDMERVALGAWANPGTLVLGCRDFDRDVPLRSKLGNKLTRAVFSAVARARLQDTQTGLRAFDRRLLGYMLDIPGERYEYEMNVLLHCGEAGIPIQEVPIETVYLDKKNSCSHFDGLRDSFRIYRKILAFASASLVSFLADYLLFLLFTTALFPAGALFSLAGNVLARFGSAALNYTLNTKAVFHSSRSTGQTLPQYILLAVGILAGNSLLLLFFLSVLGLAAPVAKPITEVLLFLISYTVQAKVIFQKASRKKGGRSYVPQTHNPAA